MSYDRIYFLVSPTAPAMTAIRAAETQLRTAHDAAMDFAKEFGSDSYIRQGTRAVGVGKSDLIARADAGAWRPGRLPDTWEPNARTKAGKALAARFKRLPEFVDGFSFRFMLDEQTGGNSEVHLPGDGGGIRLIWPTFMCWGKKVILSAHPAAKDQLGPGLTELKMSEFYKLKEKHEEKTGKEGGRA